jgi:IS5 family transposase
MKTFFDEDNRLVRLTELGDPLEKLSLIDFEVFRESLTRLIPSHDNRPGGRRKIDRVLMFKVLILGQLNTLADDRLEYLINDRLSFQRFLGLGLGDKVPDAKSIWKFREDLKNSGGYEEMFNLFTKVLEEKGIVTHTGSIIDSTVYLRCPPPYSSPVSEIESPESGCDADSASTVPAANQQPVETKSIPNPYSERQRDRDSRWTVKGKKYFHGYKNHVKVDADSKIITKVAVKPANEHDSQTILFDHTDKAGYGDKAWGDPATIERIRKQCPNLIIRMCARGYRGKPLTDDKKVVNNEINKTRARVEHVFGYQQVVMGGKFLRSVGLARARCQIFLKNLAYNFCRAGYLLSRSRTLAVNST